MNPSLLACILIMVEIEVAMWMFIGSVLCPRSGPADIAAARVCIAALACSLVAGSLFVRNIVGKTNRGETVEIYATGLRAMAVVQVVGLVVGLAALVILVW